MVDTQFYEGRRERYHSGARSHDKRWDRRVIRGVVGGNDDFVLSWSLLSRLSS